MAHELIKREYIHRGRVLDFSLSTFNTAEKGEVTLEIVHHNGGAGNHRGCLHTAEEAAVYLVLTLHLSPPLRLFGCSIHSHI